MVEVETIENFNDILIEKAPNHVTLKSEDQILELKEFMGMSLSKNESENKIKPGSIPEALKEAET
jgi:hypothetical protein